ncbi:antileukoproteinase [Anolis sagrei]|uniref:antileukoproteinase n=1 Tax=Anolis sagrei TaxID=38937 RepID=UPI003520B9B2
MKTLCSFLLLSALVLCVMLPPASLEVQSGKPGVCPKQNNCKCLNRQPDRCRNDFSCEGKQKCCSSCCGKSCMNPEQVRPGKCPPVILIGCVKPQRDRCSKDADCPQPMKCCYKPCSRHCMDVRKG